MLLLNVDHHACAGIRFAAAVTIIIIIIILFAQ